MHSPEAAVSCLIQLEMPAALSRARHGDQGAFVYGAGADYAFTKHLSFRAEYRGYVYKATDFNLASLNTDAWTHTAVPSAGIVFRF